MWMAFLQLAKFLLNICKLCFFMMCAVPVASSLVVLHMMNLRAKASKANPRRSYLLVEHALQKTVATCRRGNSANVIVSINPSAIFLAHLRSVKATHKQNTIAVDKLALVGKSVRNVVKVHLHWISRHRCTPSLYRFTHARLLKFSRILQCMF